MNRLWTLAGALLALQLAGCSRAPEKPAAAPADPYFIAANAELAAALETGRAELTEVRETQRVPGRVEVDETRMARVGAPVAGRITDLQMKVGDMVKRGQVLATLNSTDLSTAQLAYLKARSEHLQAARAAGRAQQLLQADVIGAAEVQRREAEHTQRQAELNAARGQLRVLGMSEEAITRLAESGTITSISNIVASVSGTVIDRKVTEGQVVQPADALALVADLSQVWVVADVPEQSAGHLKAGESVVVEIPALPDRLVEGRLSFVSPTVNPETRTVRARLDLDNAERLYRPAMLASVIIKGKLEKKLTLPRDAVVREENRDYVFVPVQGGFRMQPVTLGADYDGKREVTGGLRADDRVVVRGAFHLNNERKRRLQGGA